MKLTLLVLLAFTFTSLTAHATLGSSDDSVDHDQRVFGSQHLRKQGGGYSIHELTTSTTVVKEYTNANGVVFAVSWRGPKRPDLSVLFGSYYAEYETADAQIKKGPGRQSVIVKTSKMVVSRGGHMRDIHGKAFIPELVPSGVRVEDLP